MTTLQIEKVELSKTKKSYWLTTDQGSFNAKLNSGVEQLKSGDTIEAQTGESEWQGKVTKTIESFSVVQGAKTPSKAQNSSNGSVDRWYMPFISNTVAHAIQSGLIKEPGDIGEWARAAYRVAVTVDAFQDNSEIPF